MKKELYITKENISDVCRGFIDDTAEFNKRKYFPVNLEKSCLLTLDMQKYFLNEDSHALIPSSSAIKENVIENQKYFLERKLPVFLTRHSNDKNRDKNMVKWWGGILEREDPCSELDEGIEMKGARVIDKSTYDGFYETPLLNILKRSGVERVFIQGVMAHLCCETTARSAFLKGFEVYFIVDGTASYTRDFHRSAVINLSHGFAVPVLSEEVRNG